MQKIARITDSVATWGTLLLVALVPVFVVPIQWVNVAQGKLLFIAALVAIILIAWVKGSALRGSLAIPRHFTLWASALLPLAYLASALFSGNGWSSIASGDAAADTVTMIALWYLVLFLTTIVFANEHVAPEKYVRAVLAGLLTLVLFQALRIFLPGVTSLGGYLAGDTSTLFGTWHDFGIVAGISVFLSVTLWNSSVASSVLWRSALALLGAVSLFVLLVINAVDVWYGVAILSLLFAFWKKFELWRAGHSVARIARTPTVIALVALAILCAACGFWSAHVYERLPARFQIAQVEVRPSWQGTYMIGEKVFSGKKAMVFGSGPNTFMRDWGLFKPEGVNTTDYWSVDFNAGIGFIPTTIVTTGLLGFLAWAVFGVALLWSLMRALRGRSAAHGMLPAFLGAILYLFTFHILYIPGLALSILLFSFVGFVVALESREGLSRSDRISLRPSSLDAYAPVAICALIVFVFLAAAFLAVRAVVSDIYIQRAVVAYNADGSLEKPVLFVKRALQIFPENDLAHRAAVQLGLLQLQKVINAGSQDDAARAELQARLQDTISHGLSAISISSFDYQNWLSLAMLYQSLAGVGIQGAYENAQNAYARTIAENPTNPLPHVQLAQLALAQKDTATASKELDAAIALKPNFAIAYYLRSQVKAAGGDLQGAGQDALAAAQLAQQDPLAWYNLGTIFYAAGQYDYATQALSQAVSLQNNYANAIFLLGLSWDKLGTHDKALAAMQEVLKLNPGDATIQGMVANLEAGKPAVSPKEEKTKSGK